MMNKITEFIEIKEPTECPCCQYPLQKVKDQLFCRNSECSAQISKKLEHFCKVLGIKGLGPKTIEKLQLREITELFYLEKDGVINILGEKIAVKLLDEIERAKSASVATVLEAFSIPLVGNTASKKLAIVITTLEDITKSTCKQAGLGDKVTENLLNWLDTEYKEIKDLLPFMFYKVPQVFNTNAKRVCITGKLKSYKKKSDAESALTALGFILVDSVTKTTDYLVDENDSASSKREKAIQYGITIITDLNDLLKVNI